MVLSGLYGSTCFFQVQFYMVLSGSIWFYQVISASIWFYLVQSDLTTDPFGSIDLWSCKRVTMAASEYSIHV